MDNEILKWIGGVAASVSITGIIGYLWRDSIGRIMTKSVDFQYEKKVELFKAEIREGEKSLEHKLERGIEAFKTDLREGEKEIEQVRAYLVSSRTGRDTILLEKKIQAAEDLLKIRKFLSGFNNAIDFLRVLDVDNLMKNGADEKIIGFTSAISKNLEIDSKLKEYSNFDSAITKLYLSEDVIKVFEIYERIVLQATALIKILEMPFGDKEDFIKHADLKDKIIALVPASKESFGKYGNRHVFYWAEYFHDRILTELRNEIVGLDSINKDTVSAARLGVASYNMKRMIQSELKQHGLSESYIKSDWN